MPLDTVPAVEEEDFAKQHTSHLRCLIVGINFAFDVFHPGLMCVDLLRSFLRLIHQVNSTGVMPIIFSTSLLQIPLSLARFTGIEALKSAAVLLYPGGTLAHN